MTGTPEQIEMGMKSLQERGFINYYGMQRFGNSNIVPTHAVGRALLLCDWKLVIEYTILMKFHIIFKYIFTLSQFVN